MQVTMVKTNMKDTRGEMYRRLVHTKPFALNILEREAKGRYALNALKHYGCVIIYMQQRQNNIGMQP